MTRQSCLDWHFVLLKLLDMDGISHTTLKIEGLSMLVFLASHKKYKQNVALRVFLETGWYNIVKQASNKLGAVVNFKIWFDRKYIQTRGAPPASMTPKIVYKLGYTKKLWLSIGVNDYARQTVCHHYAMQSMMPHPLVISSWINSTFEAG